jgi:hypothetical protein
MPALSFASTGGRLSSGIVKTDRDRLQLGDHDQAVLIGRVHDVAGVHEAQAETPGERRGDAAVGELELDVVDLPPVGLHHALVLVDQLDLRVELLVGGRVLGDERPVALEVDARVAQERLVARQLTLGLGQLHLVRTVIDLREQVAGVDALAFLEQDLRQLAVHARVDRHRVERGHGAEPREIDGHVGLPRRRCHHRYRRRPPGLGRGARRLRLRVARSDADGPDTRAEQHDQAQGEEPRSHTPHALVIPAGAGVVRKDFAKNC